MTTTKALRNPAAQFIRRYGQKGICQHCGRDLGMLYLIAIDGDEVPMGRRCAARTLGWATTRVEMEAVRAEQMAELDRRRAIIRADYPDLAAAEQRCNFVDPAALARELGQDAAARLYTLRSILLTASTEDHFWDETRPNYGRYGTWREYLDSCIGNVA